MTVEEEVKDVEKKNVLVGIRMDSCSGELLNWALVKVAEPGDKVIACHVCRISGKEHASKAQALLDKYLEVYHGICSVNKVDLKGEILTGNSMRKALVRESRNIDAKAVILGICNNRPLVVSRGRASVARYCAKNLPPTTDILAIHNGKLVFRRCTNNHLPDLKVDPRPSIYLTTRNIQENQPESEFDETRAKKSGCKEIPGSLDGARYRYAELRSINLGVAHKQNRSLSDIMTDAPEEKLGWPLLLRTNSTIPRNLLSRNISVVELVMSLPSHSPCETPKHSSMKENPLEGEMGEVKDDRSEASLSTQDISPKCSDLLETRISFVCKHFSHKDLKTATDQFSSANLIGKGGCNRVYKGILPDGKPVAVKVLRSTKQAQMEFSREVDIMPSLKHKHILPLLGVCTENNELISVYDFLSKGCLEYILHDNAKDKEFLSWEVRFKVAIGIAEALNYLHTECHRPVIHRDIKSSNILLSDCFEPQLSDFGLAIWGPAGSSFTTVDDVLGTFGYLAPEYFMYGKVSDKIDVYAFGVILLELLSGKKPICSDIAKGKGSLVMWAKPLIGSGDIKGFLDPCLDGKFDEDEMNRMVLAATLCISQAARLRPTMEQVLKILRGDINVQEWKNFQGEGAVNLENDNDDEVYPSSSAESHLSLAFLDIDGDSTSPSSVSNSLSLEEYMRGRGSHTWKGLN